MTLEDLMDPMESEVHRQALVGYDQTEYLRIGRRVTDCDEDWEESRDEA